MIAIKSAGIARGYSGVDHLITGSELNDVIGREYRSVREAMAAAYRAAEASRERRLQVEMIDLEIADGTSRWVRGFKYGR